MENIVTWRLAAVAAIALANLTGCEQLRSYNEPTTGARARVRIVGRQPLLYSHKTCDRDDMRTSGFAYFGNKRHDLHMPNPIGGNADATEYYVVADVNLTVSFRDGGDELGAPPGYTIIHIGQKLCANTSVVFVPKAGHDYEVREHGGGFCSALVAELVPEASGEERYIPVEVTKCPDS